MIVTLLPSENMMREICFFQSSYLVINQQLNINFIHSKLPILAKIECGLVYYIDNKWEHMHLYLTNQIGPIYWVYQYLKYI